MAGDSEKFVQSLFKIALFHAPSIIFIEEIDAIMGAGGYKKMTFQSDQAGDFDLNGRYFIKIIRLENTCPCH